MSEKEEVLQQISDIKSHLIDKKSFVPYNYNACYAWSGIALALSLLMPYAYAQGVLVGTIIVFVLIAIGFTIEGIMTKKVNQSYEIDEYTKRQAFIVQSLMMIAFFLITLSAVFASYQLFTPLYLSWLAMISLGYYIIGYTTNVKKFQHLGKFNFYLSVALLLIAFFTHNLEGDESLFFRITQSATILGLTILPALITRQIKRQENCSV